MNRTNTTDNRIRDYMQAVHSVKSARIKEIRDDIGNGRYTVYTTPEPIPKHVHGKIEKLREFMVDPLRNNTVHITTPLLAKLIDDLLVTTSPAAEMRHSFTYEELSRFTSDMERKTEARIQNYFKGAIK